MKRRTFVQALSAIPFVVYVGNLFSKELDQNQGQTLTIPKRTPKNVKELSEFMEQVVPSAPLLIRWSEVGTLSDFGEFTGSITYNLQPKQSLYVGQSTNTAWSVTGEKYIEYSVGIKPKDVSEFKSSEEYLCSGAWQSFLRKCYELSGDGHKLYWRTKPEYSEWNNNGERIVRIYFRYLVSNKPEISDGTRSIGMVS